MINEELKEIIDNRDDLLIKKQQLKDSILARKANIRESFSDMKDELNPLSLFRSKKNGNVAGTTENKFSNLLSAAGSTPLVSMGVSTAANFLLKNVLLKRAGFLPRLILPFVIKKASDFIVAPKLNNKIVSAMHNTAETIRDTDVQDFLPDAKDLVPKKALNVVAKTSDKIADKLYTTAEKIRPDEKPEPLYKPSLLKKSNAQRQIAKKLHKLADRIRG